MGIKAVPVWTAGHAAVHTGADADRLFSQLANQMMQTTIDVWSSRERVLIIARLPDPPGWVPAYLNGPDGTRIWNPGYRAPDPNFEFPPARGKVGPYITKCVRELIEPHGWLAEGWSLTGPYEDVMNRGHYRFTVWRPKT